MLLVTLPTPHASYARPLGLLPLLVKARLCRDVFALNRMLLDALAIALATPHTHSLLPLDLLQLQHPVRHLASTQLHQIRDRSQHRLRLTPHPLTHLVILREQRDRRALASRAARSPHTVDVLHSALH